MKAFVAHGALNFFHSLCFDDVTFKFKFENIINKVLSDSSFKKLKTYHKLIEFIISHYTYI